MLVNPNNIPIFKYDKIIKYIDDNFNGPRLLPNVNKF